ncbi:conserved Plasmodium chabaudi protein, unknown function [Plasmodium vinckei]|uniref:PIR protein CIR protein n=1 Tax=Plasmodium vinckei TaxID=5860 RepID=A0A6V7SEL8_PLAVN|nr:conserved Plasmodium chabaudi protein, unknown function [Plasmodium vinckei]
MNPNDMCETVLSADKIINGDKDAKIVKDEDKVQSKKITLNSAYEKYLKNNIVNFNYWDLLHNINGLKEANSLQALTTPDGVEMALSISFKKFDFSNPKYVDSRVNDSRTPSDETGNLAPGASGTASISGASFDFWSSFRGFQLNGTEYFIKDFQFIEKIHQHFESATNKINDVYNGAMHNLKSAYIASSSYFSEFISNVIGQLNQTDTSKSIDKPYESGNHQSASSTGKGVSQTVTSTKDTIYDSIFVIWMEKGIEKKNMKKVINSIEGKRQTQIIIKSVDTKKMKSLIINPICNEKSPLLNIYKLMQVDTTSFINLFFLIIFFVYKRKDYFLE